jgi:hypothetical protein
MKRLSVVLGLVFLMLLGVRTATYAYNWKLLGLELTSQTENGSQLTVVLKDKQEHVFKVIYQDETMLDRLSAKLLKYKNEFFSWRNVHFNDLTFLVFANFLDVVILPQELMHNNINLAAAIPAGITMTYDPDKDNMRYDFRIMKGDQFIRIPGSYSGEKELTDKIGTAYDNPNAYMQPLNPETIESSDTTEPRVTEKMVQALIYLNNEDWNGRHKTVAVETIRKVVELRQKNPETTKAQLWQLVKKAKLQISKRQMELILILYFNEFES